MLREVNLFLYAKSLFYVPKCKLIVKNNTAKCWLCFHPFLQRTQKYFCTARKMKFPIKDFFSNCDQIRRKLPIWSH